MNCPNCGTEIDEHEANRCLDAWVAEAVMGWEKSLDKSTWVDKAHGEMIRDVSDFWPSVDIAAALQVALKVVGLKSIPVSEDAPLWICRRALRAAL